jgi:hypothetical protein
MESAAAQTVRIGVLPCIESLGAMSLFRQTVIFSVMSSGRLVIGQAIGQQPIVNVRLGPPANALPQVGAEISLLESARKEMESTHLQELDLAFASAVEHATSSIPEVVSSALGRVRAHTTHTAVSLLEVHSGDVDTPGQTFSIEVLSPHEPDVALKTKLEQMERKRSTDEEHIFQQAAREFAALETIFTNEVLAQLSTKATGLELHKRVGFLQTSRDTRRSGSADLPSSLNVRLAASAQPFPTIEGLALAMGDRRDASEGVVRKRVMELESQFFTAANDLLREALRAGLSGNR